MRANGNDKNVQPFLTRRGLVIFVSHRINCTLLFVSKRGNRTYSRTLRQSCARGFRVLPPLLLRHFAKTPSRSILNSSASKILNFEIVPRLQPPTPASPSSQTSRTSCARGSANVLHLLNKIEIIFNQNFRSHVCMHGMKATGTFYL